MSSVVHTERVLVVPTELFHRLGHFQGFSADVDRYLGELLKPANTSYRPRAEVEQDPGFKQLIPYVIFRYRQAGRVQVFQYTRGKGQGEGRLHSKCSIGIGGHISADDERDGNTPYAEGMRRELAEEVEIDTPYDEHCAGLINDDQTAFIWAWCISSTSNGRACGRERPTSSQPASVRSKRSAKTPRGSRPGRRFASTRCLASSERETRADAREQRAGPIRPDRRSLNRGQSLDRLIPEAVRCHGDIRHGACALLPPRSPRHPRV